MLQFQSSLLVPVLNKDNIRPIYMLTHQLSLSSVGAQRQCCNLKSVYIRSLQFICSALRLLVFERVSTCQYNMLKIPFELFNHTVGTRLFLHWCRAAGSLTCVTLLLQRKTKLEVLRSLHCQPVSSGMVFSLHSMDN